MSDVTIWWVRRDFRLDDNPALKAAVDRGAPVVPVFILSDDFTSIGAAARWRVGQAIATFSERLEEIGSKLILRTGAPVTVLSELVDDFGADAVFWSRCYDPTYIPRDTDLKAKLKAKGLEAKSFQGSLLFEPWSVETQDGGMYRVYSPYWKSVRDRNIREPLAAPKSIPAPETWPKSETLDDWALGTDMYRGAAVVAQHSEPGERAAKERLDWFLDNAIDGYKDQRDRVDKDATSQMSEYLTYGEISPFTLWHAGKSAMAREARGAEHFLKELVWREFAWHLYFHTPHLADRNWREEWDAFSWKGETAASERWTRGRTGVPMVDAAMREMFVTGRMHNRARMIAASYLTKHLLTDWRVGQKWFADCLTDWDPASNAMGWQWVAGSGPDAAPYFRIFNPETQREKFDPNRAYVDRWIAEGRKDPDEDALAYFDAIPKSWDMSAEDAYPDPEISLSDGRKRALAALEEMKS